MPKLIPDWRHAWRFHSVQAAAALLFLSMVQADVLPLVQPLVPPERWPLVSGGVAMLIVIFRMVKQALQQDEGTQEPGK